MISLPLRRGFAVALSLVAFGSVSRGAWAAARPDDRVRDLVRQMTVEEKVGQLVQFSNKEELTGPASESPMAPAVASGSVGSLLNVTGATNTRKWQKLAMDASRLHIPLLFGFDTIHGYRTIFPIPLATAASWDLALIEQAEHIAAAESAAAGLHWTFAPMVDIARDPRWGRISEGSGEDPFLGSAIARARVRGFQGADLAATDTILACAKHFAAYGAAQAGRDYFTTDITERVLRDVYLPPFRAAADAGAATFMAAFNDLDGTPCSANSFLMEKVLRQEWGFKGFVVSDWGGITEMRAHGYAANLRDAAALAMKAGLDMDMESNAYRSHLVELVRSGVVSPQRLDAAVTAILSAKAQLGLFDDPFRYSDEQREKATLLRPEFLEVARNAARRSCVLLKNRNAVLPLANASAKIALIGPMAHAPLHQLGAWRGKGVESDTVTLRMALEQALTPARVRYAEGCKTLGSDTTGFADAKRTAADADIVVAVLGEDSTQSGEGTSRSSLDLSGPQAALLKELHAVGKPIVLVLMTGRPLMIESLEPLVDAVLVAWHPGTMGGPGVADVLTGAYNPSGRLPVTWPRTLGQVPIFYAAKNSGRPAAGDKPQRYVSNYIDGPNSPLYPFGYGLSYTTFTYEQPRLNSPKLKHDGRLTVSTLVRNTGQRPGETVVQLYVRDRVGSVTRPLRELKGFRKLELAAGESREVSFELTANDLAFWRADMTFGAEPGDFDVFVGGDATATQTARFTLE